MLSRLADRNRRAQIIASADPQPKLQLVVEPAGGPVLRRIRIGRLALPVRADHRLPRGADRTCATVIADRHIFVVWKQRIVRPELLADVGGVMNADVEVGVVADEAGYVQPHLALPDQLGLDIVTIALVRKQFGKTLTKLPMRVPTAREPGVEHRLRKVLLPLFWEQIGDAGKVEDIVAD